MVLVTFAETKGTRRVGATPHIKYFLQEIWQMRRAQSGSRKPRSPITNVEDDGVGNTHPNIQNFCRPRIRISLRWARRSLRPESASRRRLFERSEFLSHLDSGRRRRHPGEPASEQARRDRAQAKIVFVPFAETKGTRRAGTKPRIINRPFKNTKPNLIVPLPYYFEAFSPLPFH